MKNNITKLLCWNCKYYKRILRVKSNTVLVGYQEYVQWCAKHDKSADEICKDFEEII